MLVFVAMRGELRPRISRRRLLGVTLAIITTPGRARAAPAESAHALTLGERHVRLLAHRSQAPGLLYVNVHENETTSIEAARRTVERRGGQLYWLGADGRRVISFRLRDRTYRFDPNRMFSHAGVEKSLRLYGASSPEAIAEIRRFASAWIDRVALLTRALVVAVHNSTRGGFSVSSYQAGGSEEHEASAVSIGRPRDPDDFFLVTDSPLYEHLRARGHNVVLQAPRGLRDNGSLSVWATANGVHYVNVEAQFGHLEQQVAMLAELHGWAPAAVKG